MTSLRPFLAGGLFALLASSPGGAQEAASPPEYLYLWTASADSTEPDFLAVLDVTERAPRYGRLVTTLPVPGRRNIPHHTEHEMPADRQLFANGFGSGTTFIFDLTDPLRPRLAGQFGAVDGYSHPHSFLRLPGGNVLATFQMRHGAAGTTPGGLVELTPAGQAVRTSPADAPGLDPMTRVYSAGIVPALDRIVTTTTDLEGESLAARQLQVWRLSDLALLHTITLPDGPAGGESELTAEPRVPAWNAVVSLDIRNPSSPREVGRVTLGADDVPHWIAVSGDRRRVVITGYAAMKHRVMIARFDPARGRLAIDERFREAGAAEAGFRMSDRAWPHGSTASGIPHGAVFSLP